MSKQIGRKLVGLGGEADQLARDLAAARFARVAGAASSAAPQVRFDSLPVGARFKFVNREAGQPLPTASLMTKIEPIFIYKGQRNCVSERKGRKLYWTADPEDLVVVEGEP